MTRVFDLPPGSRTGILIDGPHLWATTRSLGFVVDFAKILDAVRTEGDLVEAVFVTPVREDAEQDPMRPVTDWMRDHGYTVHTKPLATYTDKRGLVRHDGDCSIQLAVDLMDLSSRTEQVILFCGDANLAPAVRAARERGSAVTIVSTVASPRLRTSADRFLDIADLRAHIERAFAGRQEAAEPHGLADPIDPGRKPLAPLAHPRARYRTARRARGAPVR